MIKWMIPLDSFSHFHRSNNNLVMVNWAYVRLQLYPAKLQLSTISSSWWPNARIWTWSKLDNISRIRCLCRKASVWVGWRPGTWPPSTRPAFVSRLLPTPPCKVAFFKSLNARVFREHIQIFWHSPSLFTLILHRSLKYLTVGNAILFTLQNQLLMTWRRITPGYEHHSNDLILNVYTFLSSEVLEYCVQEHCVQELQLPIFLIHCNIYITFNCGKHMLIIIWQFSITSLMLPNAISIGNKM